MVALLNRLTQFSEWGQSAVLAQLAKYLPQAALELSEPLQSRVLRLIMDRTLFCLRFILQKSCWSFISAYKVQDETEMFDIMNVLDVLLKQSSASVLIGCTKADLSLHMLYMSRDE